VLKTTASRIMSNIVVVDHIYRGDHLHFPLASFHRPFYGEKCGGGLNPPKTIAREMIRFRRASILLAMDSSTE